MILYIICEVIQIQCEEIRNTSGRKLGSMADKKEGRSKSEKRYRKIRRSHIWTSIVEFLVFSVVLAGVLFFAVQAFVSYVIDTKIGSEYEKIQYMARIYDNGLKNNDSNIYNLLVEEGHDYVITGSDGSRIHLNGEDTRGTQSAEVTLSAYDEKVLVYRDSKRDFIYPKNGRLSLDLREFAEWMRDEGEWEEKDPDYALAHNTSIINLPIWISIDVDNGNKHFIGKAVFSSNRRDINLFIALIGSLAGLMGIILITLLGAGVRNFIRQRRMLSLFFTDVVTEGHNQTWLLVKGEHMIRKKSSTKNRFAVVSLKFVNYNTFCICHSVAEGDKILCRIYHLLCSKLRKYETCSHLGLGAYGLILRYNSEDELRQRLGGIIGELENIDSDHKFYFRAGVSLTEKAIDSEGEPVKPKNIKFDTEFNHATGARLSLGPGEDSDIAFFDDKLIEEQKWLDKVQEMQQSALDNEEFLVYYQPKYDPKSEKLKGAEALIRWNSPEFGLIPPGKFIPIFENNGFITEIDHYMIRHVAADQKAWLDKGYKCVPVSVNVSRAHFIESDLADQIKDMVDEIGTPHEYIEIELTESAFFDDKKAMLGTISKLKSYGFAVSMDDFGSGYSSLNSLKDMPLDVLKLDAEFFRGETNDKRAEIVVSEAIKLAKNLNMRIVAEGVEIKEQVDFLAGEGCDMIQGYYFAKPMPKEEYEQKMS